MDENDKQAHIDGLEDVVRENQPRIQSSFGNGRGSSNDWSVENALPPEYMRPSAFEVGDEIVLTIKSGALGHFEGIAVDLAFEEAPELLQVSDRRDHLGRLVALWGTHVRNWVGQRILIRVVEIKTGEFAGQNTFVLDSANPNEQIGERTTYRPSRELMSHVTKRKHVDGETGHNAADRND